MVIPRLVFVVHHCSSKAPCWVDTRSGDRDCGQVNHEDSKSDGKWCQHLHAQINKNKDHPTKGPSDAKNANPTTCIPVLVQVSLALVTYHGQNSDVQKQERGNELGNDSPIKRPLSELLGVDQWCWWRILVVLGP
ncbi:hypothetical protein SADUNF_Sadunf06G0104600 [Salix dunnii]|uniref:Uncharacterized protein n=1 Tax=Salix dunnii TaxID=1413687 RepID=A0A835K3L7_9ROSI|nr:hypothetical protein SADUNF_Sadunf06G0104600 [Salix dunnii]